MALLAHESAWEINLRAWPIIVVRPRHNVSDAQLRKALDEYSAMLASRSGPFVILMDNRHSPGLSAAQRKIIGEYNVANEARTRARCRGMAFVMTSAFVRGIMTAVFWLKTPPAESRVFEDFDEAMQWATLRARSMPSMRPGQVAR